MQWEASGYCNELEQSEPPESSYVAEFETTLKVHDLAGNRYRSITDGAVYPVFTFSNGSVADSHAVMRIFGGNKTAGTPQQLELICEREALSPERLLMTALDSSDAHAVPDTVLQSVPQNVVAFTLNDAPVRICLNAYIRICRLRSITPAQWRQVALQRIWAT